ncbi:tryptophan--tRNA ligase, mitochondrial [Leguminivora glycinivorella]|uniref:tryptophan--tRNA ligase, mitochondrial n=1 Tax=Leguminivora glycinivorella TaxID=1035111 RepID=UPI00200F8B6D|nr:tryptophan--tRNA ligase, mitochondrial [Leguminivora glycinivorella]
MEILKRSLVNCKRCLASRAVHQSSAAAVSSKSSKDGGPWERRVVSGLQPTGTLHVGNYFGALRRCARLQQAGEDLTLFVADLHSLTTRHDAKALREDTLELAALALASGVCPERGTLFVQSAVPRHAELCWLLSCLATMARLSALPQFREKSATLRDVPLGLLLYPVLQAADVLVYRATHVPVGADQLQHLQVASALARQFAHRYGPAFPTPAPLLPDDGSDRIRNLRDPAKKMSKSDPEGKSRILLTDDDAAIALKLRKAVTDFTPEVTFDPENRLGVSNLIQLHCLSTGMTTDEAVDAAKGLTTAQYKGVVAAAVSAELRPVRTRYLELRSRPRVLRDVLARGAEAARRRADETYADVAACVGVAAPALPPRAVLHAAAE